MPSSAAFLQNNDNIQYKCDKISRLENNTSHNLAREAWRSSTSTYCIFTCLDVKHAHSCLVQCALASVQWGCFFLITVNCLWFTIYVEYKKTSYCVLWRHWMLAPHAVLRGDHRACKLYWVRLTSLRAWTVYNKSIYYNLIFNKSNCTNLILPFLIWFRYQKFNWICRKHVQNLYLQIDLLKN